MVFLKFLDTNKFEKTIINVAHLRLTSTFSANWYHLLGIFNVEVLSVRPCMLPDIFDRKKQPSGKR